MYKKHGIIRGMLVGIGVAGILFWLIILFFGFLLGGSPGPGYERTVPLLYAGLMIFGLVGTIVGIIGNVARKAPILVVAAILIVLGSIPFFLLNLFVVGIVIVLISLIAPVLGIVIH